MISLRKRIYRYMILLTGVISLAIISTISYVAYNNFTSYVREENKADVAYYVNNLIITDNVIYNIDILEEAKNRITIINNDGVVIYDNYADISEMDNHQNRPEIKGATTSEYGESKRYSDTISKVTHYSSLKNSDGYTIRVAVTTSTILSMFLDEMLLFIILIVLIIAFCNLLAYILSKRIVKSISNYEEINPLITTIDKKNAKIENQTYEIESNLKTMKAITDNMVEGLLIIDSNNMIISLNKKIRKIFNISKSDYLNKNVSEFLHDFNFTDNISSDSSIKLELNNSYYNVVTNNVTVDGTYIGKVVLFIDVTKEEKVLKIRREFSSNVSHELKTPLAAILGYSELIENNLIKKDKQEEFISKIKVEAANMSELIDDILLISNLDEKQGELNFKDENINEIIHSAISRLKYKIEEKHLEVVLDLKTATHQVNYRLFYEIVYNLIDNAIKYNYDNGIIKISTSENLMLKVANSGTKIEGEEQKRIFERFYRIEKSRNRSTGGTGLGLAIVKHAVLTHNGEIKVLSDENQTEFIVKL